MAPGMEGRAKERERPESRSAKIGKIGCLEAFAAKKWMKIGKNVKNQAVTAVFRSKMTKIWPGMALIKEFPENIRVFREIRGWHTVRRPVFGKICGRA